MPLSPRERLIEHALRLITKAEVEGPEAAERARQTLAQWRTTSPDHEDAAIEAMRRWQTLAGMAADLRQHFGDAPPPTAAPRAGRRSVLRSMATMGGGAALLASTGVSWYLWNQHQPVFMQAYRTGTARTQAALLPDARTEAMPGASPDSPAGTRIDLNAQTALQVTLYRHKRVVVLERGDARFEVAADTDRPFTVHTRAGIVTVVGTAFTVSDRGGPVSVSVEHGHVRWQRVVAESTDARPLGEPVVNLYAGQVLTSRQGRLDTVRRADTSQAGAWREGWLVFDNTRLDDALPLINAYRVHPVSTSDPRLAALPLTGRFRTTDTDALLRALPDILPLQVLTTRDGQTQLRPAKNHRSDW